MSDERDTQSSAAGAEKRVSDGLDLPSTTVDLPSAKVTPGPVQPAASSGQVAPEVRVAPPKVDVKTKVTMSYRAVDADGTVTQFDVNPKAAKRMFFGGIALLVISAILIFAATLMVLDKLFG